MKTLIYTLLTVVAFSAHAHQPLLPADVAQILYFSHCDQLCQNGTTVDLYKGSNLSDLPSTVTAKIQQVAFNQAQIWGDTILESEYAADDNTVVDQVLVIKKQGLVVGYAVSYSERGWFTGDCNYISGNLETLKSCQEGRIKERSFTNSDFSEVAGDQNQFAVFQAND